MQIVYLAPDKTGRPILLYRAAEHWPGVQDPKEYTRYILYQTEKTRLRIGLGIDRQSCVLVDRVGSGRKNQDPALLQVSLIGSKCTGSAFCIRSDRSASGNAANRQAVMSSFASCGQRVDSHDLES